jgi:peptidoglycan hydrolase-like protein with peptidoglycan-binding domain
VTTQIQRQLARLGLYTGAIDGMTGPRTSAAISAFERAAGVAVTGKPSQPLLAMMTQPVTRQPAAAEATPTPSDDGAAALQQREAARAKAIADQQLAQAAAQMKANYQTVQNALNRIAYGPIAVTGQPSAETSDAIRRFELDNGLPISGEVNSTLIGHLVEIGAIDTN